MKNVIIGGSHSGKTTRLIEKYREGYNEFLAAKERGENPPIPVLVTFYSSDRDKISQAWEKEGLPGAVIARSQWKGLINGIVVVLYVDDAQAYAYDYPTNDPIEWCTWNFDVESIEIVGQQAEDDFVGEMKKRLKEVKVTS